MKQLLTGISIAALMAGAAYAESPIADPVQNDPITEVGTDPGLIEVDPFEYRNPDMPTKPAPLTKTAAEEIGDQVGDAPVSLVDQLNGPNGEGNSAQVDQIGATWSSVVQAGNLNEAVVTQDGDLGANQSLVSQFGRSNMADVDQTHDGGDGGTNNAVIAQGAPGLRGNNNNGLIVQLGSGNDATILQQDAFDQSSTETFGNDAAIEQSGVMNIGYIQQDDNNDFNGANNGGFNDSGADFALIVQDGDMNEGAIVQDDNNDSLIIQTGSLNQATNVQADNNQSDILQNGTGNTAYVEQGTLNPGGGGTNGFNVSGVTQAGNGNMASVLQMDTNSTSWVNQFGGNNMAAVTQSAGSN